VSGLDHRIPRAKTCDIDRNGRESQVIKTCPVLLTGLETCGSRSGEREYQPARPPGVMKDLDIRNARIVNLFVSHASTGVEVFLVVR
jgi:hypothetical protein